MTRPLFIPRKTQAQLDCFTIDASTALRGRLDMIQKSFARTALDNTIDQARRDRKLAQLERLFLAELQEIDRNCVTLDTMSLALSSAA